MARRLRRESQLAFEALSIEGGLLSPEWLAKVAQLEAPHQTAADYGIEKGLQIRDEIGRYWRIAEPKWRDFVAARASGADPLAAATTFATELLSKVFGFETLQKVGTVTVGDRTYPLGWSALGGKVPVVIAGPLPAGSKDSALDGLATEFGDETRRRTPFGLCQEFLNATDSTLWGIVTDGLTLRVLRDNVSLTRPAWLEADLQAIFTGGRFSDFAALWLLLHQSRFGRPGQPPAECPLEQWRSLGREEGTRARDKLREGVEASLRALGQGFLAHRDNQALRVALEKGTLSEREYFQQLLRLVYRLIFLLTVEERGLLHPDGTPDAARALYAGGYSMRGLRERVVRRSAHDRNHDAWEAAKVVFRGLATGQPALGLPALAGIFAAAQCPDLDAGRIENRYFLQALYRLSWLQEAGGLARVNWRDMGPEELGSVYESLLELTPRVTKEGREFTFAEGAEGKGHARKTTGSYYTPDSLVQVLLDSALNPVMERAEAKRPDAKAEALLELSVVDPACGSGHFLLAAARRIAARVAQHEAKGTASPKEYRRALRRVVGRCIFGVDLNPLAVELCKVGLWMEAVEPGLPLTFLDSHVQCGNALLGTMPGLMDEGIPDEAWAPIGEDDKKAASALKKRNKAGKKQASLPLGVGREESQVLEKAVSALDAAHDADVAALTKKEGAWADLQGSKAFAHQKLVADTWCAAFVWPKPSVEDKVVEVAPTEDVWRQVREAEVALPALLVETVEALARQYRFFHWPLAFPQVFARGGFDVVLGNPPWERVKVQEAEWFAAHRPDIAMAPNAKARKRLIEAVASEDPRLFSAFRAALREAEGESFFLRTSGRYPLCGRGDINSYAVFAETAYRIAGAEAACGLIVPSGILSDDTTKLFFKEILTSRALVSASDFENNETLFPGVGHGRMRFCLLNLRRGRLNGSSRFYFLARGVNDLADTARWFDLDPDDVTAVNPNSETCPVFLSKADADLTRATYKRFPVLRRETPLDSPWGLRLHRLFDMTLDREILQTTEDLKREGFNRRGAEYVKGRSRWLPVIEGKMVTFYDHRAAHIRLNPSAPSRQQQAQASSLEELSNPEFIPDAYLWAPAEEADKRFRSVTPENWALAFKRVTSATNWRTMVACVVPNTVAVSYTLYLVGVRDEWRRLQHCLLAMLNSFAIDYFVRQKTMQPSLPIGPIYETVMPPPEAFLGDAPWAKQSLGDWIRDRVAELTCVSTDMNGFSQAMLGAPHTFTRKPDRRQLLRAELDAMAFHLLGMTRGETQHVLTTFPKVHAYDVEEVGEPQTQRLVLDRYDAITAASRTGRYETPLNPPPAHDSMRHPTRTR